MTYNSFVNLGRYGRLGNQMFQYATLLSLSKTNKTIPVIPGGSYDLRNAFGNNLSASTENSLPDFLPTNRYTIDESGNMNFNLRVFNIPVDSDITGYFQSEKYFGSIRQQLLLEFDFDDAVHEKATSLIDNIKAKYPGVSLCSVHHRRGDYLKLSHVHTNLGDEYYQPAFSQISDFGDCVFIVFSDDVSWCQNKYQNQDNVVVVDSGSMFVDMCAMTFCDYHIIANSSFSWWGSWLSKSKLTIAPKKWFSEAGPKVWDDIYCEGWKLI